MRSGDSRRAFEQLFHRLAAMGVPGAGGFFDRTPREIEWEVLALAHRRSERAEELSALAWLAGGYVALGVNAPRRYPATPPAPRGRARTMTAGEMKRVFQSLAGRREEGLP
ncbi:MAG: hypothetical protein GX592_10310 [Clostridiales bacterium]|nr:hypothetical protein [Clostridiales bacterium]